MPGPVARVAVVVGNPKVGSRTATAGRAAAAAVAPSAAVSTVEVAELAPGLFTWDDPAVAAATATVLEADLLIVATPVYKASYTGLLKSFLDRFGRDQLRALATVPLMVGAAPLHSLAVEEQLRPVLVEIGASCPTRGIYVLESAIESGELTGQLAGWAELWGPALLAVAGARASAGTP
ncbi:NAD(P)H-dependent oxidoreductase [Pseudonocardia sp. NPDC049635]|uniref:NAD(P)H-dependent oxidoreductase n=1 Tax=Pseudonocardia sp. NPDC049635 TaxID=3155506 RepID=UPI0033E92B56